MSEIRVSKIRVSEIRVSEIRGSEIRGSEIRVSEIRVSKIRISSNHRELHGAIFVSYMMLSARFAACANLNSDKLCHPMAAQIGSSQFHIIPQIIVFCT